jgi:hypothetical protein
MGDMHEKRVEMCGVDREYYRIDQDGNHVRRHEMHISPIVDVDFNVIGDEDDDVVFLGL